MQLLILRHGIAEVKGPDGTDGTRRLTDEGVRQTAAVVRGLMTLIPSPEVILTSPLTRARQTAVILGDAVGVPLTVLPSLALGPAELVLRDLRQRSEGFIVVVGHEPTLSQLGSLLCAGSDPAEFMQLDKAGAMLIDLAANRSAQPGSGRLLWLATAAMLAAMT